MSEPINQKKLAAEMALPFIENGMTIGLGTGSTIYWLIMALGEKLRSGFEIQAVPTSRKTQELGTAQGIRMLTLDDAPSLSLTIDGADESDHQLNLIKGGGGALLQEKIVAANSEQLIIVADSSKYVQQLGAFPLPVEVITFGWQKTSAHIERLFDITARPRMNGEQLFLTDHGHYILDLDFRQIDSPASLNTALHAIPGVVETGLFAGMATKLIVAQNDGTVQIIERAAIG